MLSIARQQILLNYKNFEKQKEIAKINMENRQAIVAAGIYKDPIDYLNSAVKQYAKIVYLEQDLIQAEQSVALTNEQLFAEWKRIFGKMDKNKPKQP